MEFMGLDFISKVNTHAVAYNNSLLIMVIVLTEFDTTHLYDENNLNLRRKVSDRVFCLPVKVRKQ